MRVVSLTCSNTEIVAALGLGHQLVGVDDHSDHPAELLAGLPRLGPDLQIDVEAVRVLNPDLVLASLTVPGHERVVAQIEAAGLPFLAPDPLSVDDVFRDVRQIASALGVPERGEALATELHAALRPRPAPGRRPKVLVEWWPKPVIVPGRQSWVTQLLDRAGGVNPFADRDVPSTPVSDEEVLAANPDAIVICWCGVPTHRYRVDVVTRRPAWQALKAVQHGRVFPVPEAYLGRPGPRLVDGLNALHDVIRSCAEEFGHE